MDLNKINTEIGKALRGKGYTLELDERNNQATIIIDRNDYLEDLELDLVVQYELDDVTCDKNTHNGNYDYDCEVVIFNAEVFARDFDSEIYLNEADKDWIAEEIRYNIEEDTLIDSYNNY